MMRLIALIVAVFGTFQPVIQAGPSSPANYPNELFRDDFDTYCDSGGFPGGAGVPVGTKCPAGSVETQGGLTRLRQVWMPTSTNELNGALCGTQFFLDTDPSQFTSVPFAGKYPNKDSNGSLPLGQQTLRDWINSPLPPESPGQILNISHLISNQFGDQYTAVAGTDDNPLVLTFLLSCNADAKIWWSSGYIEMAYGNDPTDEIARANTDYIMSQKCAEYCSPAINQGPFPVICANGNPYTSLAPGCPSVITNPPPVHNVIAIGALAMLEPDPCLCGTGHAHGPVNWHPALYDGQLWWSVRLNTPAQSGGTVTPKDNAPMPPPSDINIPGEFVLTAAWLEEPVGYPYNWITLTIKTNTIKVEMITQEVSKESGYVGQQYYVYSVMDGIPRRYTGPFNAMRAGVGPGCVLAGTNSWTQCASGTDRSCLNQLSNQQRGIDFDDLVLYGGIGFTTNGACCLPDGSCQANMSKSACEAMKGKWAGFSTTCANRVCCPVPFADGDHDGDVDQIDFGLFQSCFTGSGGGLAAAFCTCYDREKDGDVDGSDFVEFTRCWTGPAIQFNQIPLPNCQP